MWWKKVGHARIPAGVLEEKWIVVVCSGRRLRSDCLNLAADVGYLRSINSRGNAIDDYRL